ncbi:MAG: tetratricopeptide repeat protein [Alphaproteobacteria bacterium]|nr:tetratricopeptide repeat protein [Alphaproteobacteria bacterium]
MIKWVGPAWRHRLAASATVLLVATAGPAALAMEEPPDSLEMGGGDETAKLLAEASELIEDGHYQNARLALGAVLAEAPESAEAWNRLGYLERRLQNFEAALKHYAKALTLAPEHTGALHYQAETFLALGRLDEAEANLARIEAVCDFPCPDGDDLAEQIALYRKNLDG